MDSNPCNLLSRLRLSLRIYLVGNVHFLKIEDWLLSWSIMSKKFKFLFNILNCHGASWAKNHYYPVKYHWWWKNIHFKQLNCLVLFEMTVFLRRLKVFRVHNSGVCRWRSESLRKKRGEEGTFREIGSRRSCLTCNCCRGLVAPTLQFHNYM